MFFAGLLAFVVGSAVMLFLSVVILFGIVGSMTSSEPVTVGEHAILKLDFSEDLIESPSSDPFAGIDFATMTARHQVTDRKSTRLNSSHTDSSRMPSSA